MQKDNLDNWFNKQQGCWDLAEPNEGHKERFLQKLAPKTAAQSQVISLRSWWKPLAVAASIALLVFALVPKEAYNPTKELAAVSPQMEEAQDFFTRAIEQELFTLRQERTPETEKLIKDALKQLELLETDYNNLKQDLAKSGEDKRVIHAMIINFQTRIDLLTQVVEEIESIKKLNSTDYEDKIL